MATSSTLVSRLAWCYIALLWRSLQSSECRPKLAKDEHMVFQWREWVSAFSVLPYLVFGVHGLCFYHRLDSFWLPRVLLCIIAKRDTPFRGDHTFKLSVEPSVDTCGVCSHSCVRYTVHHHYEEEMGACSVVVSLTDNYDKTLGHCNIFRLWP